MTNWKGAGAGVVWLELLQLVLVGCVARLVARGVVCAGTHYVDMDHSLNSSLNLME